MKSKLGFPSSPVLGGGLPRWQMIVSVLNRNQLHHTSPSLPSTLFFFFHSTKSWCSSFLQFTIIHCVQHQLRTYKDVLYCFVALRKMTKWPGSSYGQESKFVRRAIYINELPDFHLSDEGNWIVDALKRWKAAWLAFAGHRWALLSDA